MPSPTSANAALSSYRPVAFGSVGMGKLEGRRQSVALGQQFLPIVEVEVDPELARQTSDLNRERDFRPGDEFDRRASLERIEHPWEHPGDERPTDSVRDRARATTRSGSC